MQSAAARSQPLVGGRRDQPVGERRPAPVWRPLNEGRAGPGGVLQESLECIDASRVDGDEEGLRERGVVGEAEHGEDLG